jgi:hypothetical protein
MSLPQWYENLQNLLHFCWRGCKDYRGSKKGTKFYKKCLVENHNEKCIVAVYRVFVEAGILRERLCPHCHGSGERLIDPRWKGDWCIPCQGSGKVLNLPSRNTHDIREIEDTNLMPAFLHNLKECQVCEEGPYNRHKKKCIGSWCPIAALKHSSR